MLISSSENAIRGLLMHLCDVPVERIADVEIPTGVPLLYDVHDDPGETSPLDPREHAEPIARFVAARARHEASLVRVPSQTELLPTPSHVPCCRVPRGSVEHFWRLFWARHECGC